MGIDVLLVNTAVVDFRGPQFALTTELVGPGGLAKCPCADMPPYTQEQYRQWIEAGLATAGGPGNAAPLLARTGLKVAVGVNLGAGQYGGLDAQGRFFHDVMTANGIDMSATVIHPELPTGTSFIHDKPGSARGGIAYFPCANNDFDFGHFRRAVKRLEPGLVYYMYSGLSDRGDANGGRDLADFIAWCRSQGIVTIADSHTLTGKLQELIAAGAPVNDYHLLEPLLPELDIFFTSSEEVLMIMNTLGNPHRWAEFSEEENIRHSLDFLMRKYWTGEPRTRLLGVTFSGGAYIMEMGPGGIAHGPSRIESRFMSGEVIDLVGAGDSFRAGVIADIARDIQDFRKGITDFDHSVQMGNLFASLFINAPLHDRYALIQSIDKMCKLASLGVSPA